MPTPAEANIITGPLDVWIAPTGESLPEINDIDALGKITPGGNWTQVGFTVHDEDFVFTYTPEVQKVRVNELNSPIKGFLIGEEGSIEFMAAEKDLAVIPEAIGPAVKTTVAAGADQSAQDIVKIGGQSLPVKALLLQGLSPEGGYRIIHVHKAIAVATVAFKHGKQHSGIPVKYDFLGDSTQTAGEELCVWYDQTAVATS